MFIRTQVRLISFLKSWSVPFETQVPISDPAADLRDGKDSRSQRIRTFLTDQRGLNTVELVVIIAVVVGLALLFRARITTFVTTLLDGLFSVDVARNLVKGVTVE